MIVEPTQAAKRAVLDAAWQKQWDDNIASLTKIEWEVLAHAALPNRQNGAFDIMDGLSRRRQPARRDAIDKLLTFGFLRNVFSRNFATISDDGHRALAERKARLGLQSDCKK